MRGSIRQKILVRMLLLTLIPLILVVAVSLWFEGQGVRQASQTQLQILVSLKREAVTAYLNAKETTLRSFATDPTFRLTVIENDTMSLMERMKNLAAQNPDLTSVSLVDVNEKDVVVSSDALALSIDINKLFADLPSLTTRATTSFYLDGSQEPRIIIGIPLLTANGAVPHILLGLISPNVLDNFTDTEQSEARLHIVKSFPGQLYTTVQASNLPSAESIQSWQVSESLTPQILNPDWFVQNQNLMVYGTIPSLQAVIIAEQANNSVVNDLTQSATYGTLITIVVIFMTTGIAYFFARGLTRPIEKITETAQAIAKGDLKRRVNIESNDEIGILAQDFNVMTNQLQKLNERQTEQIEQKTEALAQQTELLQQRADLLEVSGRINRLISTLTDPQQVLVEATQQIHRQFNLRQVAFLRRNGNQLEPEFNTGSARSDKKLTIDQSSLAGQAVLRQAIQQGTITQTSGADAGVQAQLAIPISKGEQVFAVLVAQTAPEEGFSPPLTEAIQAVAEQLGQLLEIAHLHTQTERDKERVERLYQLSQNLNSAFDFHSILQTVVEFVPQMNTDSGEIYLFNDKGEYFFASTLPERHRLASVQAQAIVEHLNQLPNLSHSLQTSQAWQPNPEHTALKQPAIYAPIMVGRHRLKGVLALYQTNGSFNEDDERLASTVSAQISVSLENSSLLSDIQNSLQETHLLLEVSKQLAAALNVDDIYTALIETVLSIGAQRAVLFMLDPDGEGFGELVHQASQDEWRYPTDVSQQWAGLKDVAERQESVQLDPTQLPTEAWAFVNAPAAAIIPFVARTNLVGWLLVSRDYEHIFSERELNLYRAVSNQATIALESARQVEQTQIALAETQTLYRAGRVLAGATDLQGVLEEALIEFLYSFNLEQGGITLLNPERTRGQLMAYVQDGMPQDIEQLRFSIDPQVPYQKILLDGQPFVSNDAASDPRLVTFKSFNEESAPKSLLQAPMIVAGETAGWIGADAVKETRTFLQREIDQARAMADQISIAIENQRLFEATQRRAEQLRAVAQVGEAVSNMIDLDQILEQAVQLIQQRFALDLVSIYVVNDKVVELKASVSLDTPQTPSETVGVDEDDLLVAQAIQNGEIRMINETILSDLVLPLEAQGQVIGALKTQRRLGDAFEPADVEILQIVTDQLSAAIEKARLFEQTQRRLMEQATLYRIGTKLGATLDIQEAGDSLVQETCDALQVERSVLMLFQTAQGQLILDGQQYTVDELQVQVISDHFDSGVASLEQTIPASYPLTNSATLTQLFTTGQEVHLTAQQNSPESDHLLTDQTGLLVPILWRNYVVGSLAVFSYQTPRIFHEDDITLLDSIALQATNTIQNAQLYQEVQENQQFMRAIINQIPDPIYISDPQQRLVVVNQAFSGLTSQPETELLKPEGIGRLPKGLSEAQIGERELSLPTNNGQERVWVLRRTPLPVGQTAYQLGLLTDITERKVREQEREQLIESTRNTLKRTQALYLISHALETSGQGDESATTFEEVLAEFVQLLHLPHGQLWLVGRNRHRLHCEANYQDGRPAPAEEPIFIKDYALFDALQQSPQPLALLGKSASEYLPNMKTLLAVPLLIRGDVIGLIWTASPQQVSQIPVNDQELGRTIAGQLARWLENRQLLTEAQYRSERLQTAAEVSQASSSILDMDELIDAAVNLIQSRFGFYYVGMFLIEGDWAVLKAGTGEAGRQQIENGHRLEVGGGSMIGWSIANQNARIALDVGEDRVWFKNRYLPKTRSEMALPLISREPIGALTVQSTEESAFSDEDITLLQTMADQLANALNNARLFAQTQQVLSETERLYQLNQDLLKADTPEAVYRLAIHSIAQSDVDFCGIFNYRNEMMLEASAGWDAHGLWPFQPKERISQDEWQWHQLVPDMGQTMYVSPKAVDTVLLKEQLEAFQWGSLMVISLDTSTDRIGFLLLGYRALEHEFEREHIRFYTALVQQMGLALQNMQFLQLSQKRARREEIIREIGNKIQTATTVEDILKTTVTELSKVVGSSRGRLHLEVTE